MNFIIAFYHFWSSSEKGRKNSGLDGDSNPELCDTGAVLYQFSYHAYWEQVVGWVNYKPVAVEIDGDDSSTGRALHWHCRGQGLNPHSDLNFSGPSCCCLSSDKMRWSNSFMPIPISDTWKISESSSTKTQCNNSWKKCAMMYDNFKRILWNVLLFPCLSISQTKCNPFKMMKMVVSLSLKWIKLAKELC